MAAILEPYARYVEWRVEAVAELNYDQVLEELRRATHRAAAEDLMAGTTPAAIVERAARS